MRNRKNHARRSPSGGKTPAGPSHQQQEGFAGLDPSKMGFAMPDWMDAPASSRDTSAEPRPPVGESPEAEAWSARPEGAGNAERDPQARTMLEGMKVVCICKGIKKRVFWKALDEGMHTKDAINRCTGSGSGGCQGRRCGPRILDMLRNLSR